MEHIRRTHNEWRIAAFVASGGSGVLEKNEVGENAMIEFLSLKSMIDKYSVKIRAAMGVGSGVICDRRLREPHDMGDKFVIAP